MTRASSSDKICSVDRCDEPSYARTWCKYHYQRWYRYGDPLGEARERATHRTRVTPWRYT